MHITINNPKFAIYDDVLEPDQFSTVWKWAQQQQYFAINSQSWLHVWRLTDGSPMGGHEHYHTKAPFDNDALNMVHARSLDVANASPEIVGDWNEIIYRCYIYPRGSRIDWHNDQGYTAALIYYIHPIWSASWGGELMIAEIPKNFDFSGYSGQLDTSWKDRFLNIWSAGNYVSPKPNRMILTPAGVWHSINRIDDNAGDNCRCSIVCFFKKIESTQ